MLVMFLFFLGAILLESLGELLFDYLVKRARYYVPRSKRGYPRIKSLV